MGLSTMGSNSNCSCSCSQVAVNADKLYTEFEIMSHYKINSMLVVVIKFKGFTDFSGEKVLVYEEINFEQFAGLTHVDPHFKVEGFAPVARFEATNKGILMAKLLCESWSKYRYSNRSMESIK